MLDGVELLEKKRTRRNVTTGKWMSRVLFSSVAIIIMILIGVYSYFGTHFFPGTTINRVAVGGLSVKQAQTKLTKQLQVEKIQLTDEKNKTVLILKAPYQISTSFLSQNIRKTNLKLPLAPGIAKQVSAVVEQSEFVTGKPGINAEIRYQNKQFVIIPEKKGTLVDRGAVKKRLLQDLKHGTLNETYALANFYQQPKITAVSLKQHGRLKKLDQIVKQKQMIQFADQKIPVTKKVLAKLIDGAGQLDQVKTAAWLSSLNEHYATINQPVQFTTIHGQTLKYKNVGNYGWFIKTDESAAKLVKKLAEKKTRPIDLVVQGDPKKQPLHVTKNYVEVDLNQQRMYAFHEGKKVVSTDVITGRYTKGTATVPGFHTIMDKRRNVSLSGRLIDGDGSYSVPVKYWMPLLSYGQTITDIGLHDTDYKLKYFGEKKAYQTNLGSYGCVNTPGVNVAKIYRYAYVGMPVFIYGDIYDSAPGEFDKPVDHGTKVNQK